MSESAATSITEAVARYSLQHLVALLHVLQYTTITMHTGLRVLICYTVYYTEFEVHHCWQVTSGW
jgi:hypothetical protein